MAWPQVKMKSSSKVLGQNLKPGGEVQSMVIGQALKTVIRWWSVSYVGSLGPAGSPIKLLGL